MTILRTRRWKLVLLAVLAAGIARPVNAGDQPPSIAKQGSGNYGEPRAPNPAEEAGAAENDARLEILNSPAWHETLRALNEWLNAQNIYSKQEVAQIKRDFNAKVVKMSSRQLARFLEGWQEKVEILRSPEAQKAGAWLGQYLALHAKIPAEEFKKIRPDVLHMTAEQIQEWLEAFEIRRASVKQTQAAFDRARNQQVQLTRAELARQHESTERALDRAAEDLNAGARVSPLAPVQTPYYRPYHGYGW